MLFWFIEVLAYPKSLSHTKPSPEAYRLTYRGLGSVATLSPSVRKRGYVFTQPLVLYGGAGGI